MSGAVLDARFVVARRSFPVAAELSLGGGERLALFGPSGAGKTTCLEAIAGTADLAEGDVHIGGELVNVAPNRAKERPLQARQRGVAFVRQPTTLFPHLDVAANVGYGLRPSLPDADVQTLLGDVGLGGLGRAMPESLSGGQRQRACLARALGRPFRLLLLDEPFAAIDVPSQARLRQLVIDSCTTTGAVAIFVSHDLTEAQAFAGLLAVIDEGQLMQVGAVDVIVRKPASVRVARLLGYRGFLSRSDGSVWALHPDRFIEGAVPERGVVVDGVVRAIRPHGPRYAFELEVSPGGSAVIEVHLDGAPRPGERWQVTALDPPVVAA